MSLRSKLKERVRRSIVRKNSGESKRKSVSKAGSASKKPPVRRARPFVEELDNITPRTLLKQIIQNEPEVSILVSQRSEVQESKDADREMSSEQTLTSVGNLDLSFPELQEDEHVTTFGNARKKYRISVTQFEKGVEERLPQTQESNLSKMMGQSGNQSVFSQSLRTFFGTPEPEVVKKRGLARRPKKYRLVSLKDFEQGVEHNFQILKGSQDCFIDSTEEEDSSPPSTPPNENADMNTELYDLSPRKNKLGPISDLEGIKEHKLSYDSGGNEEQEKAEEPMELNDEGVETSKYQRLQKSDKHQEGLNKDHETEGFVSEKTEDLLRKADGVGGEMSIKSTACLDMEEHQVQKEEAERSAEMSEAEEEVVMGTPVKNISQFSTEALHVARMTASNKKRQDIRLSSSRFDSSQGRITEVLPQTQDFTDSVFISTGTHSQIQNSNIQTYSEISKSLTEKSQKTASVTKRRSDLHSRRVDTKEQTVEETDDEEPEEMEEQFEGPMSTIKSSSVSISKRKSVQLSVEEETKERTVEDADNEREEGAEIEEGETESEELRTTSLTIDRPRTSLTEKILRSASIKKRVSIQLSVSKLIKEQTVKETDIEGDEQDVMGREEPESEELQPVHSPSAGHIEKSLKSASVSKRMSVQASRSDHTREQAVMESDDEAEEQEKRKESESEELQPSPWTVNKSSTSRTEKTPRSVSSSITKRMSVQPSQSKPIIEKMVQETDSEGELEDVMESEKSENEELQPVSRAGHSPSASRIEKSLKSSSVSKRISVQPSRSEETREQTVNESYEEAEEQEETDGDESESEDVSIEENQKPSNEQQALTPLPVTPAYIKNIHLRLAKKPPPVGKRVQKKRSKEVNKMNPTLPRSFVKQMFSHYAQMRVSKETFQDVEKCLAVYMEQLSDDLAVYSAHANRKTVTRADLELLMRRQGLVTDAMPLNVLIERHLPMEYRKLLIPCAMSGNKVYPKI
ncbi:centromere protein T isoform X2 [Bombina bombina]|uniref:centromere protein T isoform X2 n=1 Tax=Bombina bombina TaxID=8345 RepID=UPI00235A8C00|nr:centromere protein T isoform X2 [Bombina bombina]